MVEKWIPDKDGGPPAKIIRINGYGHEAVAKLETQLARSLELLEAHNNGLHSATPAVGCGICIRNTKIRDPAAIIHDELLDIVDEIDDVREVLDTLDDIDGDGPREISVSALHGVLTKLAQIAANLEERTVEFWKLMEAP